QRMGQLVNDDGGEDPDRAEDRHPDVGCGRKPFEDAREVARTERPDDQRHQNEPREIETDVESEDTNERQAPVCHRRFPGCEGSTTYDGGPSPQDWAGPVLYGRS